MACDLTLGRIVNCKEDIGGLEWIGFINDGDLGTITYDGTDTDKISTIDGTQHLFHYDLKGAVNTFTQNIVSSRDNGTTYFEQVLEVTLPNLSVADHKELKLLAYGNPKIVVGDNNSNYFLMGLKFGADVTGGTIVTGGAMGDLSGYTLSFTAMEPVPANFFNSTTLAALATSCNFVIVKGDGSFVS